MKIRLVIVAGLLLSGFTYSVSAEEGIAIAELKRDTEVNFAAEVLPVLRRKCLACHNATDAESDLVLETPQAIMKGGASGHAIMPGKGGQSLMLQVAAHLEEPFMPPADNDVGAKNLTPEELALLKLWIDQGAQGEVANDLPLNWQPLPDGVNPVYSVAVSPDGQFLAAGRANQIFLYHLPSKREVGRLTDPNLLDGEVYQRPGIAHLDLVQSLTFSPDSRQLASGGYRVVKLWQRERDVRKLTIADFESKPTSVAVSSDGLRVAVGQENGTIVLVAGTVVQHLRGHTGPVTDVAFAVEGNRLVSTSRDKTLRVWRTADGELAGALEAPAENLALGILAEPDRVAIAHSDNMIRIWNLADIPPKLATAEPVIELKGHSDAVTALEVFGSPAKQLASGSLDGTLRTWDAADGKQTRSMDHGGPVQAVACRVDGSRFASASSNHAAKLWAKDGTMVAELKGDYRATIHVEDVQRALAVCDRHIANSKEDLKQANSQKEAEDKNATAATEAQKKADEEVKAKEKAAIDAVAARDEAAKKLEATKAGVAAAEEEKKQATGAIAKADGLMKDVETALTAARKAMEDAEKKRTEAENLRVAATERQKKADELIKTAQEADKAADEEVTKMAANIEKANTEKVAATKNLESAIRAAKRAGKAVQRVAKLVPAAEASVKVAEQQKGETEETLKAAQEQLEQSQRPLYSVAFSPNGQTLATGGDDQAILLWDAETGIPLDALKGHQGRVNAVAFNVNGDVISVADDRALFVWNAQPAWRFTQAIGGVDMPDKLVDRVTALDFSPDGQHLATGSGEPSRSGELKVWNLADGSLVSEFKDAHSDSIFGLEYAPDGKLLASGGADRFAKLFDVSSTELVRTFEGHTHHVLGLAWRCDGRVLATSGADNVIKVWNTKTGEQIRTISGFGKEVTGVQFLATGDDVVASSGDQNVRIKNASNGKNVRDLGGSKDFLYSISASASGQLLAAGGEDSVVRVWQQDGKEFAQFLPPAKE